jgi:Domain of unknown function (DUF1707)
MRAGDGDRLKVVEVLQGALDEGRLSLSEYDERVATAYKALTYADLNVLLADLPHVPHGVLAIPTQAAALRPHEPEPVAPVRSKRKRKRRIPLPLMILWTIWLAGVGVNLAVWLLVSVASGHAHYFWPMWVIGPAGAALLAATIGIDWIRHRDTE